MSISWTWVSSASICPPFTLVGVFFFSNSPSVRSLMNKSHKQQQFNSFLKGFPLKVSNIILKLTMRGLFCSMKINSTDIKHLIYNDICWLWKFLWMEDVLETLQLPASCAASPCCTAMMMNVPVWSPVHVLLLLIVVFLTPRLPPPFPPSMLNVLLSVRLRLGLSSSSESSLLPPVSPPSFLSSSLLFFDLLKPPSSIHSALDLHPHTSKVQDLCLCWAVTDPM